MIYFEIFVTFLSFGHMKFDFRDKGSVSGGIVYML